MIYFTILFSLIISLFNCALCVLYGELYSQMLQKMHPDKASWWNLQNDYCCFFNRWSFFYAQTAESSYSKLMGLVVLVRWSWQKKSKKTTNSFSLKLTQLSLEVFTWDNNAEGRNWFELFNQKLNILKMAQTQRPIMDLIVMFLLKKTNKSKEEKLQRVFY